MEKIATFAERFAKIGALVVGLAYVIGFLTVSLDLGSYGLTPVEHAKASYLAVGFFELLFLAAFVSFGFFLAAALLFPLLQPVPRPEANRLPWFLDRPHPIFFAGASLLVIAGCVWFAGLTEPQWPVIASVVAVMLTLIALALRDRSSNRLLETSVRLLQNVSSSLSKYPHHYIISLALLCILFSGIFFLTHSGSLFGFGSLSVAILLIIIGVKQGLRPLETISMLARNILSFLIKHTYYIILLLVLLFVLISGAYFTNRPGPQAALSVFLFAAWTLGNWCVASVPINLLPGQPLVFRLSVGLLSLCCLVFALYVYIAVVYPQMNPPFGGRKPFVALIVEGAVEKNSDSLWLGVGCIGEDSHEPNKSNNSSEICGIPIKSMPSGTRIGPAYVVLEKSDSIVLSRFPWIYAEARSEIDSGKAIPYIEIPRSRIRQRGWVSRSKDKSQPCH